jgi:hydrogenase expression/formation protein HypD
MAEKEREKDFVFFAIGFETTAPSTAVEVINKPPENFTFLVSHRLIPPAMKLLVELKELNLEGFIAPGHVSTIIGARAYEVFPSRYGMPTIIAGFEPLDVLFSVYMILRQVSERKPRLENEYIRAVQPEGNLKAKELMKKTFKVIDGDWRGLGTIPSSSLKLKSKYQEYDARSKYRIRVTKGVDIPPGCKCHLVIIGKVRPTECPLFMKKCTPQAPVGPCMVSNEGTCRIWAKASDLT